MLRLQDVEYSYRGGREPSVRGVSLTVGDGECIGLVGHTGSGKSTLAQLIAGLIKADKGEIWLDDLCLSGKRVRARELCRRVGIVFQYPETQLFAETVRAELEYAPRNLGLPEKEIKQAVQWIAERLRLTELLDANPYHLSGGEMRRVALGAVLIMRTPLLILDEPFVGLDGRARQEFLALLEDWRQEIGASIICVSHDIEHLVKLCDRLWVMRGGELVLDEDIRGGFDRVELLAECGVYPPIGRQAVRALRLESMALTIAEAAEDIERKLR